MEKKDDEKEEEPKEAVWGLKTRQVRFDWHPWWPAAGCHTANVVCILIIYYFINLHACGGTLRLRRLWVCAPICGRVAVFNCQVEPQTTVAADDDDDGANNVRRFSYRTFKPVD